MRRAPGPVADIDGATFRSVVGHLASGVTVITCAVGGTPHGMTASSVTSLSADPPMMLACVNRSAPTSVAIRAAGGFVVNVLRAGQEHLARQFARPSDNKFAGVATTYGALSMPVLREALACLECEVCEYVDAGTHTVLLGRVVDASASDGEPLAYFRGSFGRLQRSSEVAAYLAVRRLVLDGAWGENLRDDELVAATLGLDRRSVSQALKQLISDGLLTWSAQRGYQSCPFDPRATQKAVSARGVLEAGVIAVALAGVGDRELRTVARKFVRMDDLHSEDVLVDVDGFFSANVDFHRSIVELASNPVITSALDRLDLGPLLARTQAGTTRCSGELIEVQRDLLKALLGRDVDAAIEYVLAYAAMAVDRTRELSGADRFSLVRTLKSGQVKMSYSERWLDKVAVVTGSGSGIGAATAKWLARNGVSVLAATYGPNEGGEEVVQHIVESGGKAVIAFGDVAKESDVEGVFEVARSSFGPVDILVQAAGGMSKVSRITDMSTDEWDRLQAVNLRSAFLGIRAGLPSMIERGWGRIVTVSSEAGRVPVRVTSPAYAAAKAGVVGLTKHVAREVAATGVTINATAPSVTVSPRVLAGYGERLESVMKEHPAQRLAEPEEQAAAIVFLCSPEASYINGACIDVTGGAVNI